MNSHDDSSLPVRPAKYDGDAIEATASEWLALQEERALSAAELATFEAWQAASPRHADAVAELSKAWRTFDQLQAYPRAAGKQDDPEFFGRPHPFRRYMLPFSVAAAAIFAAGLVWFSFQDTRLLTPPGVNPPATPQILHLVDGSEIELKPGSQVVTTFSPAERRLRLVEGEAYFSVAKDPMRPFIVEANGVAVRAVGTAFNVRLDSAFVEVVVTEGTVRVGAQDPIGGISNSVSVLDAGQRAVVSVAPSSLQTEATVETLAPPDIDRLLSWQTSRLTFDGTPLAEVVASFNRHNARQIVLRGAALGVLPVSGRFRAGNVDGFLELLESGFGVIVERGPQEIVIHSSGH